MIQLEITEALALYSGILMALAAAIWIITGVNAWRSHRVLGKQYHWRCYFCGFSYLDEEAEQLSECPRCKSLNSAQDKHTREIKVHRFKTDSSQDEKTEAHKNPSRRKRPHQRRRGPRKRKK